MKHPKRRERGFTLIEMLVVLAILFIAVMLSAPYLSKQIQRSKLIGVAQQASGLMRMARMDAIKTSLCSMVRIDPAGGSVVALSDRDGDCLPSAPDVRIGEVILPDSVSFASPCGAGVGVDPGLDAVGGQPERGGVPERRLGPATPGRSASRRWSRRRGAELPGGPPVADRDGPHPGAQVAGPRLGRRLQRRPLVAHERRRRELAMELKRRRTAVSRSSRS